jgi:hypothetical protein
MFKKTGVIIFNIWVLIMIFVLFPNVIAQSNYLNDSNEYTINAGSPQSLQTSANLTINDNINHTFEGKHDANIVQYRVQYFSSNLTGFLLDLLIKGQSGTANDEIERYECDGSFSADVCTSGCGGNEFRDFHNFSVVFDQSTSNAKIYIDGTQRGTAALCTDFTEISGVNFTGVVSQATVKNNFVTADNSVPIFIGNIPDITWDEDTSTDFNISGNFSDDNNDSLVYTYRGVENISISINNNSGVVNLTPDPDFVGTRYVIFVASDGANTTDSNNVTLSVTNVNDAPSVTSAGATNEDFLNRTNGSLIATWTFTDSDDEVMSGNETLWYLNGIEDVSLRNLTAIGSGNTTKNQNWSFSVRVFDGSDFSSFFSSSNVSVDNALQFFNPALDVENADRNKLFTYDVNFTDLDGDTITFSDNSSLFDITSEGIITFTPTNVGNMTVNVTMSQNPDVSDILTIEVGDVSAPVVTEISTSSSGTTTVTVTLSVTTDEISVCNYAILDLNYTNMTQMSSTNSTSHSNGQDFTSDESGTYYVRCDDTLGNIMNTSSSVDFSADVEEPASGSSSSGSSGGGSSGSSGWSCRYKVECTDWSKCANGEQSRTCENVNVPTFYSETKCEYLLEQETERQCLGELEEVTEDDVGEEVTEEGSESNSVTGAVIFSGLIDNIKPKHGLIALGIIIVLGLASFVYFKKPSPQLSEEEMQKLHKMMENEYLESKEEERKFE